MWCKTQQTHGFNNHALLETVFHNQYRKIGHLKLQTYCYHR